MQTVILRSRFGGLLLAGFACLQCASPVKMHPPVAGAWVPTDWIEKVRHYDYNRENLSLLKEFEQLIKPDTLDGESEHPHVGKGIMEPGPAAELTPLFVNLDNEPGEELIGVLRYARRAPTLFVCKKIENEWYLLHHESIFVHNEEPELVVVNNRSANKLFYVRFLQESGSGIHRDSYRFYKLLNNKVRLCLELPNHSLIYGWGLYLNQEVELKLQFSSTYEDVVEAIYRYSFFPGAVFAHDVPWAAHPDTPLVQGKDNVYYQWNDSTGTYQFENFAYADSTELTENKIATFGNFTNDTLFVRAFAYEIRQGVQQGTPEVRRQLQAYLRSVQNKQKPAVLSGAVERKKEVNGTQFFGPRAQ